MYLENLLKTRIIYFISPTAVQVLEILYFWFLFRVIIIFTKFPEIFWKWVRIQSEILFRKTCYEFFFFFEPDVRMSARKQESQESLKKASIMEKYIDLKRT